MSMHRFNEDLTGVVITNSLSTTQIIPFHGWAGMELFFPANSPLTSLTWYAAKSADSTASFLPVVSSSDVAETTSVSAGTAGAAKAAPAILFAARGLKAVGTFSTGTSATIDVSFKA